MVLLSSCAVLATCFVLSYWLYLAIYRLYFHPLASFPGSKLAALSTWHELYHDAIRGGQLIWEIQKMHDQHGPIVRISPDELHIRDADFYNELYLSGKAKDKYARWCNVFGPSKSIFATVDHDLHKARRSPVNNFFSHRAVTALEPVIRDKVESLMARLDHYAETRDDFRIDLALMALTMDIICRYCFGFDYGYLKMEDFGAFWKDTVVGSFAAATVVRTFPWIVPLMESVPIPIVKMLNRGVAMTMQYKNDMKAVVGRILNEPDSTSMAEKSRTILHTLKYADLPPPEKSLLRLTDEAILLVGAGSETTSNATKALLVYVVEHPHILRTLQRELDTCMPDPSELVSWQRLTELPYLTAVIQESLRLSYGLTARNPRVSANPMVYKEWLIPAGTPVSQSAPFVLHDADIYPNPDQFDPERWLGPQKQQSDKYQIVFGRGTRQCLGINLAYAELYLASAALFRRFKFELVESSVEDVLLVRDYLISMADDPYKGVKVRICGKRV